MNSIKGGVIELDAIECIIKRQSCRFFTNETIEKEKVFSILNIAISAPSAKNRQPWKFCVLQDKDIITNISNLSHSSRWLKSSNCLILIYLEKSVQTNYTKDVQSIGAVIQNMLLAANAYDIASCWNGDLLKYSVEINKMLNIVSDNSVVLMATVALGYPNKILRKPLRDNLVNKILLWK